MAMASTLSAVSVQARLPWHQRSWHQGNQGGGGASTPMRHTLTDAAFLRARLRLGTGRSKGRADGSLVLATPPRATQGLDTGALVGRQAVRLPPLFLLRRSADWQLDSCIACYAGRCSSGGGSSRRLSNGSCHRARKGEQRLHCVR